MSQLDRRLLPQGFVGLALMPLQLAELEPLILRDALVSPRVRLYLRYQPRRRGRLVDHVQPCRYPLPHLGRSDRTDERVGTGLLSVRRHLGKRLACVHDRAHHLDVLARPLGHVEEADVGSFQTLLLSGLSGVHPGGVTGLLAGQQRDDHAGYADCPCYNGGNPLPCHEPIMAVRPLRVVPAPSAQGRAPLARQGRQGRAPRLGSLRSDILVPVTKTVPPYTDMLWPTLQSAIALGGSASIAELDAAVIDREQFSSEQQEVLHGDGPQTEIQYRLAWARTYLKGMGLLTNSKRGVWAVTEAGQGATEKQIGPLHSQFVAAYTKKRKKKSGETSSVSSEIDQVEAEAEADWKDELLETLIKMSPTAFERLAQRLLRESGFSSAVVTGRSGDGGIDGLGVYQLSLLSFPVFFQCKRYSGSVTPSAVRDFRGASSGGPSLGSLTRPKSSNGAVPRGQRKISSDRTYGHVGINDRNPQRGWLSPIFGDPRDPARTGTAHRGSSP